MNFKEDRAFKLLIFKKMLLFVILNVCKVSHNSKRDISLSVKTQYDKNSKRDSSIASLPQNDKGKSCHTRHCEEAQTPFCHTKELSISQPCHFEPCENKAKNLK